MELDESRRRFCVTGLACIGGGIGVTVLGAGGVFLGAPAITNKAEGQWIEAGEPDDFDEDLFTQVVLEYGTQDGWAYADQKMLAFVKRQGDEFYALSATCSHLGCNVRWDNDRNLFICPCHAGTYDEKGINISGPPPKPLDRLPVQVEDGAVMVYNKKQEDEADA